MLLIKPGLEGPRSLWTDQLQQCSFFKLPGGRKFLSLLKTFTFQWDTTFAGQYCEQIICHAQKEPYFVCMFLLESIRQGKNYFISC
jgi:hypothetical protein